MSFRARRLTQLAQTAFLSCTSKSLSEEPSLLRLGNPVLRNKAKPVTRDMLGTPALNDAIQTLKKYVSDKRAQGLAAPQIGMDLQIAVYQFKKEWLSEIPEELRKEEQFVEIPLSLLINPVVKPISKELSFAEEACFTIPEHSAVVPRFSSINVSTWNEKGDILAFKAVGWKARIIQHEYDHLMGILYVDRMLTRTFCHESMDGQPLPENVENIR